MSVQSQALALRDAELLYAGLAVRAIQRGQNPSWFIEQAGMFRAERYELEGTADVLRPLLDERIIDLRSRMAPAMAQWP